MKIYIDFDDVLCETAEYFTKIAKEMFGIEVPYRQVQFFNLQKSFDLNDEQYEALMKAGHLPENLLNYEETPGASEAINKWVDQGHEVFIITGRPFNSYEPSRQWLDEHHLERVPLFCVDKYGRETAKQDYRYNMTLAELYNMTFDFAVEDSPAAFEHVIHFDNCRTAVFDRPWNSRAELPNDRFVSRIGKYAGYNRDQDTEGSPAGAGSKSQEARYQEDDRGKHIGQSRRCTLHQTCHIDIRT